MWTVIAIKVDPRMKEALQKVADKQFISMSAAVKQAIEKYLQEQGVDWREKGKKPRGKGPARE
jgi:predicted transcriptional regulator